MLKMKKLQEMRKGWNFLSYTPRNWPVNILPIQTQRHSPKEWLDNQMSKPINLKTVVLGWIAFPRSGYITRISNLVKNNHNTPTDFHFDISCVIIIYTNLNAIKVKSMLGNFTFYWEIILLLIKLIFIIYNRPSEPVDIRHLLSMGYQKDWFKDQNDKHSDERIKKQVSSSNSLITLNWKLSLLSPWGTFITSLILQSACLRFPPRNS